MIAFLKGLLLLPVAVAVVLLAVANRGPVTFSLDPVTNGPPQISFTVPLFALLFAALVIGVVVGGVGSWLAQRKHRSAERTFRREAQRLRQERDRLRARPGPANIPAATSSSRALTTS